MLHRILSGLIQAGHLEIVDSTGHRHVLGDGQGPRVVVRLRDRLTPWKIFLNPELHAGEAYMDGRMTIEEGSVRDLLEVFCENLHARRTAPPFAMRLAKRLRNFSVAYRHFNPVGTAQRKVAHHYDLNERLFRLFLDRDLQYSSAYFQDADDDLETAQARKKTHIAAKLLLESGMRVLDIGSGWGGLALFLAREFGVEVTGLTLSKEQFRTSSRRAAEENLENLVRFRLEDYREHTGRYDRIVSVGMFEHVGKHHYGEFFSHLKRLLTDDGMALVHSIGNYSTPGPISPWVQRYIFPGAYIPALSEVFPAIENNDLWATDVEILRLHYAETLRIWNERFQRNRRKIRDLYDERFCRMWELYLLGCEMSFRKMGLMVFQTQLAKDRYAVPLTRDYMVDTERNIQARSALPKPGSGRQIA